MKFVAVAVVILAAAIVVPQSRSWLEEIWGRFLVGGNLSVVIVVLTVAFVLGAAIASQERI